MSDCYRAAALMSGWGAPPIPGFPSTTTWECCSPGVAPYITCDETGTITALDLSGVGWTGTVADSVSALPGLLRLDLSRNRLSGLLPAGIFGMTSLMFLNVSGNMLAGVDDMDMSYIGTVDVSGNLPSLAESLKAATGVTIINTPVGPAVTSSSVAAMASTLPSASIRPIPPQMMTVSIPPTTSTTTAVPVVMIAPTQMIATPSTTSPASPLSPGLPTKTLLAIIIPLAVLLLALLALLTICLVRRARARADRDRWARNWDRLAGAESASAGSASPMIQVDSPPPAYETDDDAAVFGTETEPPAPSLRIDTTYSTLHRSDAGRKPPLPIPRHLNLNRSDTRSSAGGSSSSLARSNTDASASSAPSEVREWDVRRVCGWLRSTGFDDAVVDVFRKKGVDGSKIGYLTAETLKTELGIRELGVRIRIVDAIRDLN